MRTGMRRGRFTPVVRMFVALTFLVVMLIPIHALPQLTPTAHAAGDCARFVSDINYPDGAAVPRNTTITKKWKLFNCGTTNWNGYSVRKLSGTLGPSSFTLGPSGPNAYITVYATFNTGPTAGWYQSTY